MGFSGLAAIIWLFWAPTSWADDATNKTNQQIQMQLKAFVADISSEHNYSRTEYEANLPDERLNLETCDGPLTIENRSRNRRFGRLTLRVSCDHASKPWAVNISVNLIVYDEVVVSSRPIPKGSKITPNMLLKEERNVTRLHRGYFKEPANVTGAIARFSLSGNRVIKPGNVLPPMLVTRGEKVVINAGLQGLSIRTSGVALSDGALGEVVRVKNSRTERIIEGRVSAAGEITVSL